MPSRSPTSTSSARLLLAALLLAAPAAAQEAREADDPLVKDVAEILAQPGRDLGIVPTRVPELLEKLLSNPYHRDGTASCAELRLGIAQLTALLGPDWGDPAPPGESREEQLAKAGLRAGVSSAIPFQGLVREVTGAAAAERRRQQAIEAGLARRGYLRGIAREKRCRL
ncbi:hypothetical protein [Thermaurantiacus tibetensis]|uniref:hypothetical protein n=1 Tax=Thermaurantiacus tibetensis TaxID=2759035 RepID=UPI00188E43FD|nr:hypothetical protein [Thermaurantiacus tibetensis]